MTYARARPTIDRLLRPRSVAILGISERPGALGNQVLANLERHGFNGAVHLINPKRDEIAGRACLRSVADLPEGVDAAVLAIPAAAVLDSLRQLAARRVGAAVIFSAGFAEGGDEGAAAQREMAQIAAESGMIVEGPNCLGLVNYVDGVALTFVETPAIRLGEQPGIAIISQSGAMAVVLGTTLMSKALGISISVSTGNEAATGVEDYVEHLLDDPHTRTIAMIVEHFRQPRRFLAAAQRARTTGKRIVLLHPGRSGAARESAATHTGAMAGDWQVMRALVEHAGVTLVDSLEELGDVAELSLRYTAPRVRAQGVAVLTESGAFKALTLDLCEAIGVDLPTPREATVEALRAALPPFIPVSNPMDLTAQALVDPDLYRRTLEPLLDDDRYGAIVLGIIQTDAATARLKLEPIIATVRALRPNKPVIFAGLDEGAPVPPELVAELRRLNVAYFPSPDRVFRALARWRGGDALDAEALKPIALRLPHGGSITEHASKTALAAAQLRFPAGFLAHSPQEAVAIANRVGWPVVLKAQAAALGHKSDAGGVLLNILDEAGLLAAWDKLNENMGRYDPDLNLDGVLVEQMGEPGVELIVGARNDPDWGPVLLVGFGGVLAEVLRDVRLIPPTLSEDEIARSLRGLKAGALFDGWRGSPPLDVAAVVRLVRQLGRVMLGTPAIREVDLNPMVVYPVGQGAVALDALIEAD